MGEGDVMVVFSCFFVSVRSCPWCTVSVKYCKTWQSRDDAAAVEVLRVCHRLSVTVRLFELHRTNPTSDSGNGVTLFCGCPKRSFADLITVQ